MSTESTDGLDRTTGPMAPTRPLPQPTPLSAPHWEGCRHGHLLVQRCSDCGSYVFPPGPNCTSCLSEDLEWVESTGHGTVHSYSVVWRPQQPAFSVPYIVLVVQLSEGWHMLSNLTHCDPGDVWVGMPVEVAFQQIDGQAWLPMFRPAPDAAIRADRDSLA
jgi:uncharacterized protein